jgi:ABC-type transport system involved in multi-copper enzyme maturation permease subunit
MSARRVGLVAWHVFKESVRDRVLYGIAAFAVLMVASAILIAQITAGQDVKIIKDLGLAVVELAGVLMAIVIGVGLVSREIDRRSIFALLSKPLPRWEFVVGKYFGLVLTLVVNVLGMVAALYGFLAYAHVNMPADAQAVLDSPVMDPRLLLVTLMILGELALLTAVALFFSTFSSSALLSIAFTVGVFVTGLFSGDLRGFGDIVDVSPVVAGLVQTIGWVVPAFSAFDIKAQVVHGLAVPGAFVAGTLLYAALYTAALVVAAVLLFSRREFK